MNCKRCGKHLDPKVNFCKNCGEPVAKSGVKAPKTAKPAKQEKKAPAAAGWFFGKAGTKQKTNAKAKAVAVKSTKPAKKPLKSAAPLKLPASATVAIAVVAVIALLFGVNQIFKKGKGGQPRAANQAPRPAYVFLCNSTTPSDAGKLLNAEVVMLESKNLVKKPSDIAVSADGKRVFVADPDLNGVQIFALDGNQLTLKNFIQIKDREKPENKNALCYVDVNGKSDSLYVLDCGAGVINEYDQNGTFKRTLDKSEYLKGTRSIEYINRGQGMLMTAVPPANGYVAYGLDGKELSKNFTALGRKCEEFSQPCYATIGESGKTYVIDTGNFAIKTFGADGKYERSVKTEVFSTIFGPQIILNEKDQYMAVTIQHANSIYFYSLDGKKIKKLVLSEFPATKLFSPSAMAQDAAGNYYAASPNTGGIARISLREKVY